MKSLYSVLVTIILLFTVSLCQAQRISLDVSFNKFIGDLRTEAYSNIFVIPHGMQSFIFSNKLSTKIDYRIGIGTIAGREHYFKERDTTILDETTSERYQARYLSANFGVRHWLNENRKGLYIESLAVPHFLIHSRKEIISYENSLPQRLDRDGKDSYESFNIFWNNGVGYDVYIYKGISAYFALNGSLTFGPYVKGKEGGITFDPMASIGASYQW